MILAVFEIPFLEFDDFNPKKIKVPKVSRGFEKSYFLDVFYVLIVFLPQNKPPGTIFSPRTSLKSRFFKLGSFQIRTLGSTKIFFVNVSNSIRPISASRKVKYSRFSSFFLKNI